MVTITPVLQRWSCSCPFWPVNEGDFLLPVFGSVTPDQMGSLMWALIGPYVTTDDLSISATDTTEAIETYLAVPPDEHYAAGGLRITDGHAVIDPGCCVGLDEWREWLQALQA